MLRTLPFATAALVLGASVAAQLPAPNPIPRVTPRANWKLTPGVTGTPTQRRDNPGAASNDKLYMFGGRLGNATATTLNALYEFDGTAWTLKTAEGAVGSPPTRGGACVAWNFTSSKLVVFGGDDGNGVLRGDTWEWDPVSNTWTDVTPVSGNPSPRRFAAMSWDPVTGGMLMFGGDVAITTPVSPPSNETWLFINGSWFQLNPSNVPPARRFHSMCTRTDFGDIFLCAGTDDSQSPVVRHLDAWVWAGGNWILMPTQTFPHGTSANQAVYDPIRQRVILQGGQGISVPNTAAGGQYGDLYGGSPSTWCSEFDCISNEWKLYGAAAFGTADPVIGRASRYFAGFIPALGKVYKVSGQNPSGTGTTTGTCQYQADILADFTVGSPGCTGPLGNIDLLASSMPWQTRDLVMEVDNVPGGASTFFLIGLTTTSIPLSVLGIGSVTCVITVDPIVAVPGAPHPVSGKPSLRLSVPDSPSILGGAPMVNQAVILNGGVGYVSNRGDATFGAM